jgi:hypothetical protein
VAESLILPFLSQIFYKFFLQRFLAGVQTVSPGKQKQLSPRKKYRIRDTFSYGYTSYYYTGPGFAYLSEPVGQDHLIPVRKDRYYNHVHVSFINIVTTGSGLLTLSSQQYDVFP